MKYQPEGPIQNQYPTLYCRDSLGNLRIWFMFQNGDSYTTTSGLLDGEKVTSTPTIALPKNEGRANETTGEEQASLEIEARYKKQRKSEYFDDIAQVDTKQFVSAMLAKKLKDYEHKIDFSKKEWLLQIKFNGNRCLATALGLFTRTGERYISCPHIEESLKPFFAKYPNAVLDSELFNYDYRQQLNEINKLIRKTVHITPEDLKRSKELVKIYVYDGYSFSENGRTLDENEPYETRKAWIDANLVGKYPYIEKVDSIIIESKKQLDTEYRKFLEDHQEGGILRLRNGKYEAKRTKNLLKIKEDEDDEGVILSISDADGNWRTAATTAVVKWKGREFECVFKGSFELRQEIFKNQKDWIGKTVTFNFMGLTGLGNPNFGRIDPKNCFKN